MPPVHRGYGEQNFSESIAGWSRRAAVPLQSICESTIRKPCLVLVPPSQQTS